MEGIMSEPPSKVARAKEKRDDRVIIPEEIRKLHEEIKYECDGRCTLTGSACLEAYIAEKMSSNGHSRNSGFDRIVQSCTSNDVDIFVPDNPDLTCNYPDCAGHSFYANFLPRIFFRMQQKYGITPTKVVRTIVKDDDDYYAGQFFNGITSKIEFSLMSKSGLVVDRLIQLITILGKPDDNVSWDDFVVKRFDIDVCQGVYLQRAVSPGWSLKAVVPDGRGDTVGAPWISFPFATQRNINEGRYEYTLKPGRTFKQNIERMLKYRSKGFELAQIKYGDDTSPRYRRFFDDQMRVALTPIWLGEWESVSGLRIPGEVLRDNILPFLRTKKKIARMIEEELILDESVTWALRQSGGKDPLNRGVWMYSREHDREDLMDRGKNRGNTEGDADGIVNVESREFLAYGV